MIEPSFMDDIDLDISGDFFDHIDDLLDFPSEEVDGGILGDCNGFQGACPAPDALAGSGTVFSGNSTNSESELPTDFCVPHEDIAQLEWLSNFVEDSFSAGSITLDKSDYIGKDENNNNKDPHQFRTSSPVSVLESSSSCSGGKPTALLPETSIIPGRARSKRPRPTTFTARPRLPIISPTSSATDPATGVSSDLGLELESFAESHPSKKFLKPVATEDKKKKKKKLVGPPQAWADQSDSPEEPVAVRKCLHCQITKTPQWRAGPMGPKTLCNACGVRYKSGRLFPEYRPAASPTFVASLHSNSHKKVLEMRTNAGQKMEAAENVGTPPPEFIPKSSHLLDYA